MAYKGNGRASVCGPGTGSRKVCYVNELVESGGLAAGDKIGECA